MNLCFNACALAAASTAVIAGELTTPPLIGAYSFNDDYTSLVPGAPDLVVVESGTETFLTKTFAGRTTGTWSWLARTGLVLDTNGLLSGDSWTVGMTFLFDSTHSWNKILDTQNRTLDFGWYNNPGSVFAYVPAALPDAQAFTGGQEVTVVIAYDGSRAIGYLNGVLSVDTGERPDAGIGEDGLLHFFLDDLVASGNEVSSGTVAALFVWDGALSATEVEDLLPLPQMIEPCGPADIEMPFGIPDLADINAFVTAFLARDAEVDFDMNGLFDLADITAFIAGFSVGCP